MVDHDNPYIRLAANAAALPVVATITGFASVLAFTSLMHRALLPSHRDDTSNVIDLHDYTGAGDNARRCCGDIDHADTKPSRAKHW